MLRNIIYYAVIFVSIVGIMIIGYYVMWRFMFFSLIQSTPSDLTIPTSTSDFEFTFNRQLSKDSTATIDSKTGYKVSVINQTIKITDVNNLNDGENLNISLNAIDTKGNKTIVSKSYHSKYIAFDNLSDEQKKQGTAESNSFEDYKLVDKLPLRTVDYIIDYTYPDSGSIKMPIVVTVLSVKKDQAGDSPENLAAYKKYRDQAMDYLKANGFENEHYQLYFPEPYLLSEYNAKDAKDTSYILDLSNTGGPSNLADAHKIVNSLPHFSFGGPYEIGYSPDTSRQNGIFIDIDMSTTEGRKKALQWMRDNDFDPINYNVRFLDYNSRITEKESK